MIDRSPSDRHVVHAEPDVLVERVGRTVLMMVRGAISSAAIEAMHREVIAVSRVRRVATLTIVGPDAKLPTADVHAVAERATRDAPAGLACAANVLLAGGFFGAALRSIVTAIETTAGRGQRRRSFGALDAALQWVAAEASLDAREVSGVRLAVHDMGRGFGVPVR